MSPLFALLLVLQQGPVGTNATPQQAYSATTPPSGDTVGYWQQRVHYRIVATLDESRHAARATGELIYTNESPDTLREMYFHQYLNAFRPGSKWSAEDAREGRDRFQHLKDPDYGYERFTATPTFDGTPVTPDYPGAPDSTVVHFRLPHPLAPGDSMRITLAWEARPSTVPRRQGRRGRSYDFAQWYPKVAVYDRLGWEPHPLVPAGELYGEFGTYDVTLVVPEDQVLGASAVPVEGDPGWAAKMRAGSVTIPRTVYPDIGPGPDVAVPPGYRKVRFVAERVHHFAWSASPDYLYEGLVYTRDSTPRAERFPVQDSVPVHVLYRPGDEREWGNLQAAHREEVALRWLESIYGPYGYPQVTNLHRIEGGGTEFPMMVMNGSASQGLILHESGHIYTYGMLANNEWRSGWMDEGLTSYQTAWAEGLTPQERARRGEPAPRRVAGYAGHALRPSPLDLGDLEQFRLVLLGRAQPIGTPADQFSEFGIYNQMIYSRAQMMYSALRDAMGDSAFRAFLHDYYDRWAFRHVDEHAMQASAERAYGKPLGWFFHEWVHEAGLLDYALRGVVVRQEAGGWVTRARVVKTGDYVHPMPVGVRTTAGWTIARGAALAPDQWVEIRTTARPAEVRLDPLHTTPDWDRRNDVWRDGIVGLDPRTTAVTLDWPFLSSMLADRMVVALAPLVWYGTPGGVTGALRARTNYQGLVDVGDVGIAVAGRTPPGARSDAGRFQGWLTIANPRLPFMAHPLMGQRVGAWRLDGITLVDWRKTWDLSPFIYARGPRRSVTLAYTGTYPYAYAWADPQRWQNVGTSEVSLASIERHSTSWGDWYLGARGILGITAGALAPDGSSDRTYGRVDLEAGRRELFDRGRGLVFARLFTTLGGRLPLQRAVRLSSLDPVETFTNHWLRPAGSPLGDPNSHFVALGGAGLHGFDPRLAAERVTSGNVEVTHQVVGLGGVLRGLSLWGSAFGDLGFLEPGSPGDSLGARIGDAGVGIAARGRLYARPITVRLDFPIYVSEPQLALQERNAPAGTTGFRWTFSFGDPW